MLLSPSAFPPPARSRATFAAERSGFCPRAQRRPPTGADTMSTGVYAAARANIKANLFRARKEMQEEGERGRAGRPLPPPHLLRAGHQNAIYAG